MAALFNPGADGPLTYGLSGETSGLPSLTSNRPSVVYAMSGNVLTAYVESGANTGFQSGQDTSIFTLTVGSDGSWSFTLLGQLDHPVAGTEDNLFLDLGSAIKATDSDGDSATAAAGAFVVNVDDDMPQPWDGCPTDTTGTNAPGTTDTESLNLPSVGADQPGTLSFGDLKTGDPVLDSNGHQLSSGGSLLHYVVDGTHLEAQTTGGATVFTIDLDMGANNYTFHEVLEIDSSTTLTIDDLSSVGGGNVDAKGIDVANSPYDLILTTKPATRSIPTASRSASAPATASAPANRSASISFKMWSRPAAAPTPC